MSYNATFNALPDLPDVPVQPATAKYITSRIDVRTLTLSGYGPLINGAVPPEYTGRLGLEVSTETGYKAARLTGMNLLLIAQAELGTLDVIDYILNVEGFISSEDDYYDQPSVLDGCSELMLEVFGDQGKHTRSAIGTSVLAYNICVEITMTIVLK